ncbi:MAG: hypothetical protein RIA63_11160, partial [Cyclobacteriaceae bacterium]
MISGVRSQAALLFRGLDLKENIYWGLVKRLLLVMSFYTICRISFYLFNIAFFPDMTFVRMWTILLGGLKFDLSAILYINSLFILLTIIPFKFRFRPTYQKVLSYLFLVTNGIGLAMNTADNVYYKFTLRRTTVTLFSQFEN